jgi:ECF sigma factor/WD40 repeat protein
MADSLEVTALLRAWAAGQPGAADRLVPVIYQQLRRRAAAYLRDERRDHTLQPTALVHEAYLRVVGQQHVVIRVGTREPPRMLAHGIAGVIPAWSPDGEWIAYQTDVAVRLVSPDGARQRFLTTSDMSRDLNGYGWDSGLVWSRDGGSLCSIRQTENRTVQMIAIDAMTGAVRVVSTLGADFYFAAATDPGLRFTLAPDGKSFLATIVRTRTDLWILEDFAPRGGVLGWFRRR